MIVEDVECHVKCEMQHIPKREKGMLDPASVRATPSEDV